MANQEKNVSIWHLYRVARARYIRKKVNSLFNEGGSDNIRVQNNQIRASYSGPKYEARITYDFTENQLFPTVIHELRKHSRRRKLNPFWEVVKDIKGGRAIGAGVGRTTIQRTTGYSRLRRV